MDDAGKLVSLCIVLIISSTVGVAAATTTHEVMWERGFHRAAWESKHKLFMGDKLLFSYNPEDNSTVMTVSHSQFKSCDTSFPYSTFQTGKSMIIIDRENMFFISGVEDKCRSGLKLHVQLSPVPAGPSHGVPSSAGVLHITTFFLVANLNFLLAAVLEL